MVGLSSGCQFLDVPVQRWARTCRPVSVVSRFAISFSPSLERERRVRRGADSSSRPPFFDSDTSGTQRTSLCSIVSVTSLFQET